MLEVLKDRVGELGKEAQNLVEQRDQMVAMIQEMEVRLHQISGAITELDKLINSSKEEKLKE